MTGLDLAKLTAARVDLQRAKDAVDAASQLVSVAWSAVLELETAARREAQNRAQPNQQEPA